MDTLSAQLNQSKPTRVAQPTPGIILDWLNSEEVFGILVELEKQFKIPDAKVRVLPDMNEKLMSGLMLPTEATPYIEKSLAASPQDSLAIVIAVKERILNPIAIPLKRMTGVDLISLPGAMPSVEKTIPEQAQEEIDEELDSFAVAPAGANDLEPLVAGPVKATATIERPRTPGMETPGLRVMKDLKPPVPTPPPAQPVVKPVIVAATKPFMLHEEKPLAPTESAAVRVDKNFSFDAGPAPTLRASARPVAAELGSSFDAMLDPKKPAAPVIARTVETPKVVHYTSMKTPLDEAGRPKG